MTLDKLNPKTSPIPSDKLLDKLEGRKAEPKATPEGSKYDGYVAFQMAAPDPEEIKRAKKLLPEGFAGLDPTKPEDVAKVRKILEGRKLIKDGAFVINAEGIIQKYIEVLDSGDMNDKKGAALLKAAIKDLEAPGIGKDSWKKGITDDNLIELIEKIPGEKSKPFLIDGEHYAVIVSDASNNKTYLVVWDKNDTKDIVVNKANNDKELKKALEALGFSRSYITSDGPEGLNAFVNDFTGKNLQLINELMAGTIFFGGPYIPGYDQEAFKIRNGHLNEQQLEKLKQLIFGSSLNKLADILSRNPALRDTFKKQFKDGASTLTGDVKQVLTDLGIVK